MQKITILGLAVAISMVSCIVPVAEAEPIPSPYQQVRDGVPIGEIVCAGDRMLMLSPSGMPACVFEKSVLKLQMRGFEYVGEPFDMFQIKSSDMPGAHGAPELTAGPVISMSTLPAIGETAIVEITYTNLFADLTAGEIASGHDHFKIGWTVGAGFEIVDNGGNTPVKRVWNKNTPLVSSYWEFLPLNLNESKTYRIEVRAVDAGLAFVAGSGYLGSGTALYLYLDQDETLPLQEHRARHPEMHPRSTVPSTPQPPFPREEVEYVPPSRELLVDFFEAYFAGSDPGEIGAAMDFVQVTGWHLNYTLPDLKQILGAAGYTDKEIEAEWSSRVSTR